MGKLKMTTRKKYLLSIIFVFCSLSLLAENKLAIINDPDGFTNVRSGQGNEFPVIEKINKGDFFYCDLSANNEWIKIVAMKWKDGIQVEGYIHRSRIQLVEKLDNLKQKELIKQILTEQRVLAENFQNSLKTKNDLKHKTTVKELELYSDIKYSPILEILLKYFCSTNDTDIIQFLFNTMWADKGSANEIPSLSIGSCFTCKPEIVIQELRKLKSKEEKKLIFDNIEFGLQNNFNVEEDEKSNNKEFNKLKLRLDNERKQASP
ncbi:hypothetical protein ABIB40_004202 [Pedobacter sp. UYP30]|uniref:SH3 domain-containing protein n=1 Tax=Pedobacter sp. UYP30 TaxID=1756400 RepID=UPI0033919C51